MIHSLSYQAKKYILPWTIKKIIWDRLQAQLHFLLKTIEDRVDKKPLTANIHVSTQLLEKSWFESSSFDNIHDVNSLIQNLLQYFWKASAWR